ncbi:hypothetical protein [Allomesorhizobium alhagi]|nr:hypothetical protein [Mesorhizobium alhagi]
MTEPVTAAVPANIAEFIVAEVHRQTAEAALRAKVEAKIGECVSSAVDSAFRSYGDVGKQIEKAVAASLNIGDRIDVPAYGNMVMAVLRAKMDEVLGELVNNRLAAEMNDILSIAPKEVKLSAVVEAMIDDIDKHDRYGTYATCILEESEHVSGYWTIYLDPSSDVKKYDCALRISVTGEGAIYSLVCDRKDAKTTVVMGGMDTYQKMVFAAYCCGSKFIIDDPEPSTGIGDF